MSATNVRTWRPKEGVGGPLELINRQSWATRAQVRPAVFDYIEVFFNRQRLHSSLNYMTPVEYEATKIHQHKAAYAA